MVSVVPPSPAETGNELETAVTELKLDENNESQTEQSDIQLVPDVPAIVEDESQQENIDAEESNEDKVRESLTANEDNKENSSYNAIMKNMVAENIQTNGDLRQFLFELDM